MPEYEIEAVIERERGDRLGETFTVTFLREAAPPPTEAAPDQDKLDALWVDIQEVRDRIGRLRDRAESLGKDRASERMGKAIAYLLNAMQNLEE